MKGPTYRKLSQEGTQRIYNQLNQGLGQHISSIQSRKGCGGGRISQLVSWDVDGLEGGNRGFPGAQFFLEEHQIGRKWRMIAHSWGNINEQRQEPWSPLNFGPNGSKLLKKMLLSPEAKQNMLVELPYSVKIILEIDQFHEKDDWLCWHFFFSKDEESLYRLK